MGVGYGPAAHKMGTVTLLTRDRAGAPIVSFGLYFGVQSQSVEKVKRYRCFITVPVVTIVGVVDQAIFG